MQKAVLVFEIDTLTFLKCVSYFINWLLFRQKLRCNKFSRIKRNILFPYFILINLKTNLALLHKADKKLLFFRCINLPGFLYILTLKISLIMYPCKIAC